jgi:hypothetical protein
VIGGKVIVSGRRIVAFDIQPILKEASGLVGRLQDRNRDLHAWADRMVEAVP